MRKFLGSLAIAFVLLAPAGAALAQDPQARDPFVPLIQPSPTATGNGTVVPTGSPVDPTPDPNDPLPSTGSSSTLSWAGLGYVLVALGSGAVVLSKLLAPSRRR